MTEYIPLIKKSFSLYRKNPIVITPFMLMGFLSLIIYYSQISGLIADEISVIVFQATSLLLFIIIECGALGLIVKTVSNGRGVANDFKRAIENKWLDYIGGTLLLLAILLLGLFPLLVSYHINIFLLSVLSVLGILYIGITIFLFLFFKQAILIDDETPFSSLEKSVKIVKNNTLEVLIYLLTMALLGIFISIPMLLTTILSLLYAELQIFVPLGVLITLILSPISILYSVLFYMEVR